MIKNILEKLYTKCKGNLVFYDAMTGVYNRNYYEMKCRKRYENKDIHVYLFDMNKLKDINDKHGHEYGDDVIKALCLYFANYDWEMVRLGGDEFVAFSKEYHDLREDQKDFEFIVQSGFSYGYHHKTAEETFSEAIKLADENMYLNKNGGR